MHIDEVKDYLCPKTGQPLHLKEVTLRNDDDLVCALLGSSEGDYAVVNGIPDFTYPKQLGLRDSRSRDDYNEASNCYNDLQTVTFNILAADEAAVRQTLVNHLSLQPGNKVLETAAGTGLNFPFLAAAMAGSGEIYAQDISSGMLGVARDNIRCDQRLSGMRIRVSLGNASCLPFQDGFFDAALSFGGIGVFSDQKKAIAEMARVVRPGGRVVFGDEGVAPWLREVEYGKVLMHNNPFYANQPPFELLPVGARDVAVQWIMGGGFYMVSFTVGEGCPEANFDFPIPGRRGGTLLSRYYGQLEGVSLEAKSLAEKAQAKSGKSMHEWLDTVVRRAAREMSEE